MKSKTKEKRTTIAELEEILPMSSTVELKPHLAYLIKVKPSKIITSMSGQTLTPQKIMELKSWITRNNLNAFLIVMEDNDIQILELKKG
jgi:hypothetical protein